MQDDLFAALNEIEDPELEIGIAQQGRCGVYLHKRKLPDSLLTH
jgi:hypothetical protein